MVSAQKEGQKMKKGFFETMVKNGEKWENWVFDGEAKRRENDCSREGAKAFAIQNGREIAEDIARREISGCGEAIVSVMWQRPTTEEEDEAGFVPSGEEVASFKIRVPDGTDEDGEPLPWGVVEL